MAHYTAETIWSRGQTSRDDYLANRYHRRHLLRFDGGAEVKGSSSPSVVPLPHSDPAAVDPEEAFVSALSACHMLWFLSLAAARGFCVDRYIDRATGVMQKNGMGQLAMTVVTLHPLVEFSGVPMPSRAELESLHHEAHDACYLARSVRTEVRCEPAWLEARG
ncbi:MAG: OsmC family protein [Pseudomonadota bacterium]|nr:OsmC family protein [Pseudomonadota bacterium]